MDRPPGGEVGHPCAAGVKKKKRKEKKKKKKTGVRLHFRRVGVHADARSRGTDLSRGRSRVSDDMWRI